MLYPLYTLTKKAGENLFYPLYTPAKLINLAGYDFHYSSHSLNSTNSLKEYESGITGLSLKPIDGKTALGLVLYGLSGFTSQP